MTWRLDTRAEGFDAAFERLVSARRETGGDVRTAVADIIAAVRQDGDDALRRFGMRFDGLDDTAPLRLTADEIETAVVGCAREDLDALEVAATRIHAFHERQRPRDDDHVDHLGVRMGWRYRAISSVGLYVPGGTAAYPSSVLMNAVPARVAGCERLVMAVPTPRGRLNPLVLAAARLLGIEEIWRIGGAQAVAALAYGTRTLAPVDKIVGPGNAYVAEAKRQVFGAVGIDMVAGPSEVLVVADGSADPAWIAADLLSQAEHDVDAQAILVTDDGGLADAVVGAVATQLERLERAEIARTSWQRHGAVLVTGDLDEAPALVDRLAPEHLELVVCDPEPLLARIRHAGSVFIGATTPEVIGDYVGGPNHVLPTGRSARFASGLGVLDFMKRTTVLQCPPAAFAELGPIAERLARAEGLDGHARAIACRRGAT